MRILVKNQALSVLISAFLFFLPCLASDKEEEAKIFKKIPAPKEEGDSYSQLFEEVMKRKKETDNLQKKLIDEIVQKDKQILNLEIKLSQSYEQIKAKDKRIADLEKNIPEGGTSVKLAPEITLSKDKTDLQQGFAGKEKVLQQKIQNLQNKVNSQELEIKGLKENRVNKAEGISTTLQLQKEIEARDERITHLEDAIKIAIEKIRVFTALSLSVQQQSK